LPTYSSYDNARRHGQFNPLTFYTSPGHPSTAEKISYSCSISRPSGYAGRLKHSRAKSYPARKENA
jgi:hypothetical protein